LNSRSRSQKPSYHGIFEVNRRYCCRAYYDEKIVVAQKPTCIRGLQIVGQSVACLA
jgi:hypothetical protein